uniref:Uncharacterized protein n=1 Tax=Kalanchoe fedtschenkoi TaxID=63787 RepID=A0A7N0VCY5_KALFE
MSSSPAKPLASSSTTAELPTPPPGTNSSSSTQALSKWPPGQIQIGQKTDFPYEQSRLWSPFIRPTAFLASPAGIIVCSEDDIVAKITNHRHKKRKVKRASSLSPPSWIKNLVFRLNVGIRVYATLEAERILLCFGLPP